MLDGVIAKAPLSRLSLCLSVRPFVTLVSHTQIVQDKEIHHTRVMFLPRCTECRRGLAMRIPSVRLSVRLTNEWIVTKRNKISSDFYTIRNII